MAVRASVSLGMFLLCAAAWADVEPGLVAHYDFDDGAGEVLHDKSGHNNHGDIHAAEWVGTNSGAALRFGAPGSYVDFGDNAALKITGDMTLIAWVKLQADRYPDPTTNWTILSCERYRESGFLVRISGSTSRLVYRSNQPGASQQASSRQALWNNTFHHLAIRKSGPRVTYFIDGRSDQQLHVADPAPGPVPLTISAKDQPFDGLIDDLKMYRRALSDEEIQADYRRGAGVHGKLDDGGPIAARPRIETGPELSGDGFTLRIGPAGGMQIEIGGEVYFVESFFSYPGRTVGYNALAETDRAGEPSWKPRIGSGEGPGVGITASGRFYALNRRVAVDGGRVRITDRITNTADQDVGVMVRTRISSGSRPVARLLCGMPVPFAASRENPTALISQRSSGLGMVAEDTVSRAQFRATAGAHEVDSRLEHLGLAPGKTLTLEWTLHPLSGGGGYWSFINRVRRDWGTNFTLDGPGTMLHVTLNPYWEIFGDKGKLAAYLERFHVKIIALGPWLDYENLNYQTKTLVLRDEFKRIMGAVKAAVRAVDPSVRLLGSIETPYVCLPRPITEQLYAETIPRNKPSGFYEFTAEQMRLLESSPDSWQRWKDSIVWTIDGRARYELYRRHGRSSIIPMIALTVYPAMGNGQHAFLMEQVRFIMEQAGLDGVYLDSFTSAGRSYDKWDGVTVDIDPATGRITRRYTDCALAGTESRKAIIEYILGAGGTVVTNGQPVARETQSLAVIRFDEAEWAFDPLTWPDGQKPPLVDRLCRTQLGSPIALGYRPERLGRRGMDNYAKVIIKAAITYLRHGVLYYHFSTAIPETGPGSGAYGPFNHMFPITPVRLGEGFVEGRERIVTCVSGTYLWKGDHRPRILLFDSVGRETKHAIKAERTAAGWKVAVKLHDWQEIAVIEERS